MRVLNSFNADRALLKMIFMLVLAISAACSHAQSGPQAPPARETASIGNFDFENPRDYLGDAGLAFPAPLSEWMRDPRGDARLLPLNAIGAIVVDRPPYRATISYIGTYLGEDLFITARHLVDPQVPLAAILRDAFGQPIRVPLEPRVLFSTVKADMAILRARLDWTSTDRERLRRITPLLVLFAHPQEVLARWQRAPVYTVGRAHYLRLQKRLETPGLASETIRNLWRISRAAEEEQQNRDERTQGAPEGDVGVVIATEILGRGQSQMILDPDGLEPGKPPTPFLASPIDWKVDSIALRTVAAGRSSGSPILVKLGPGRFAAVALQWTTGVAADVVHGSPSLLDQVNQNPAWAFGDVFVTQSAQNKPMLSTRRPAPFSYAGIACQLYRASAENNQTGVAESVVEFLQDATRNTDFLVRGWNRRCH